LPLLIVGFFVSQTIILAAGMPVSFFVLFQIFVYDEFYTESDSWLALRTIMLTPWLLMICCIILAFNLYIMICGILAAPIFIGLVIYEFYEDYKWALRAYQEHVEHFRVQEIADKTPGVTANRLRAQ